MTEDEGAVFARVVENQVFRFPMYLRRPAFGWGFIHAESSYGKSLGIKTYSSAKDAKFKPYTLYTTDSGYLTMLIMFGYIGFVIIALSLIKILLSLRENLKLEKTFSFSASGFGLLIIFLLVSLTHAPLIEDYGLIPLVLILALSTKIKNENTSRIAFG